MRRSSADILRRHRQLDPGEGVDGQLLAEQHPIGQLLGGHVKMRGHEGPDPLGHAAILTLRAAHVPDGPVLNQTATGPVSPRRALRQRVSGMAIRWIS